MLVKKGQGWDGGNEKAHRRDIRGVTGLVFGCDNYQDTLAGETINFAKS